MAATVVNPDRLLRITDVMTMVGLSRVTIWRLQRTGQFPQSVKVSARAVAWRLSEVQSWMASRPAV